MLLKINFYLSFAVFIIFLQNSYAQSGKNLYSNGNVFNVLKYVYTDLDDNIINRNDNVKKTTFTIDSKNKEFIVKMGGIYDEHYYYNKVERNTRGGITTDVYQIYKSFSSQNRTKTLSDVMTLEVDSYTKNLKSYKLYFGNKGFITFYVTSLK